MVDIHSEEYILGQNIRKYRLKKGWSQKELSDVVDIDRADISKYENERINDRGVKIDTELVQQAIACDLMLSDAMSKKAYELTGLENPNSVSQLKSWLDERGIPMDTLGKKDVAQMIDELDKNGVDAEAMDMLKLRLQMAKSSVKKYQAAERCVCSDGRARGLFQFYEVSRTGRYFGRNIQLQNLPQNHISTLDEAREPKYLTETEQAVFVGTYLWATAKAACFVIHESEEQL